MTAGSAFVAPPELVVRALEAARLGEADEAAALQREFCASVARYLGGTELCPWWLGYVGRVRRSADYFGAYDAAKELFDVERERSGEQSVEVARVWRTLGALAICLWDPDAAREQLERALSSMRRLLRPSDPELALVFAALWPVTESFGRVADAEKQARRTGGVAALHALGVLRYRAGRLEAAEHFLRTACDWHRDARSLAHATCLADIAKVYTRLGRWPEAQRAASNALAIRHAALPAHHPELTDSFHTLGLMRIPTEEAYHKLHYALVGLTEILGEEHPHTVECRYDVLHAARRAGMDSVRQHAAQVLPGAASDAVGIPGVLGMRLRFQALVDLACLQYAEGDAEQAKETLASACSLLFEDGWLDEKAEAHLEELVQLLENSSDGRAILAHVSLAHLGDRWVERMLSTLDADQRAAELKRLARNTSRFLECLADYAYDVSEAVAIGLEKILLRKSIATEADARNEPRLIAAQRPKLEPLVVEVEELRARLEARAAEGPTDGHRKLWRELDELRLKLRHATARLAAERGTRRAPKEPDVTVDAVAAALPAGSVLVEFAACGDAGAEGAIDRMFDVQATRYVAFVLHSGRPEHVQLIDLGDGPAVEAMVFTYLVSLNRERESIPRDYLEWVEAKDEFEAGRELRRHVFDRVRGALGESRRLFISPDGAIARVPFAALPEEGGPEQRLVDTYTISYLRTGRSLVTGRPGAPDPGEAPLAIGDPDFEWSDGEPAPVPEDAPFTFLPLPETADEVARVRELVGGRQLVGREATEAALRSCRAPSLLHLATHGFYLRRYGEGIRVIGQWRQPEGEGRFDRGLVLSGATEYPMARSGLALAGVNAWSDARPLPPEAGDGIMTAGEVAQLNLGGTQLVVLSACQTALSDTTVGEGAAGLVQGFHIAGAQTVVATLWEIPSESTVPAIEGFYRALLRGAPRAEALRDVQLERKQECLAGGDTEPWSWGAFVCYGDWRPLAPRPVVAQEL